MSEEVTKTAEGTAQAAPNEGDAGKAKVIFTEEQQAEVQRLLDKQYAKVMTKAEKKEQELAQAAKLAAMGEGDRTAEELRIAKAKIAELEGKQLVDQIKVELSSKGLPAGFTDYINAKDADSAKAAIDFLAKYKGEIEKAQADKIKQLETDLRNATMRGDPPKVVSNTGGTITEEMFKKMSLIEKQTLKNTSPETYKKLINKE